MKRSVPLVAVLLGCTDPAEPAAPPLSSSARVLASVDTLNAAIHALYREGGRIELLQLLYPDAVPPDPTLPPVVVIILKQP